MSKRQRAKGKNQIINYFEPQVRLPFALCPLPFAHSALNVVHVTLPSG